MLLRSNTYTKLTITLIQQVHFLDVKFRQFSRYVFRKNDFPCTTPTGDDGQCKDQRFAGRERAMGMSKLASIFTKCSLFVQ